MRDVNIEIMGFDTGSEIKVLVSSVAEKLQESSPSDSALKLALRKSQDAVEASCRIASQVGVFVAETVTDSPLRAIQEIENKIRLQLDHWKRNRFNDESSSCVLHACSI